MKQYPKPQHSSRPTKVQDHDPDIDIETLKFWKSRSAKSKLDWLSDALEFFGNPNEKNKKSS